ncbi:uncharacterized protein LOC126755786 [Bactrocera neohumeralis]|uniref:uncharacterized protein LOC126755786 n=1 Tax=Bactrocera neohumeralis TaxID=98809 RepID=UPI0021657F16|nr:uncharacterized protein LOC126755786 [Bactrocera neohumeralis]
MASENSMGRTPENPFRRNSKMLRTPPNGKNEKSTAAGSTFSETADRASKSEEKSLNNEPSNYFNNLGCKLKELENMMAGQRHVNQAMRDLLSSIMCLYSKAEKPVEKTMVEKATQLSHISKEINTPKRLREASGELPPTKKPKKAIEKVQQMTSEATKIIDITGQHNACEKWVDVVKKRKPIQKKIRTKPDAIIITKKEGSSYADILRKIKSDSGLEELGANVTYIRKTMKGDLLIELKNQADKRAESFQSVLEGAVGEMALIQPKTHSVTIVCKDLDEITTPEEICEALKKECDIQNLEKSSVKSMRKVGQS